MLHNFKIVWLWLPYWFIWCTLNMWRIITLDLVHYEFVGFKLRSQPTNSLSVRLSKIMHWSWWIILIIFTIHYYIHWLRSFRRSHASAVLGGIGIKANYLMDGSSVSVYSYKYVNNRLVMSIIPRLFLASFVISIVFVWVF